MAMSTQQVSRDLGMPTEVMSPPSHTRKAEKKSAYGQAGPVFLSSRVLSPAARDLLSSPPVTERITAYDEGW